QQMLAELERRFTLLVSRQRDLPPRHRTLWAVMEGSYRLLPPAVQRFFTRLAVFRGGWTLEAARAVCSDFGFRSLDFGLSTKTDGPNPPEPLTLSDPIQTPNSKLQNADVLDHLELLRECSLVLVEEEAGGTGRYRLLET